PRAAVAGGAWLPRRNFGQERRRQWQCARGARLALKRKHRRGIVGTAFGRGGETGEQGGGQADIARDGKRRDFGGKGLHAKQPRLTRGVFEYEIEPDDAGKIESPNHEGGNFVHRRVTNDLRHHGWAGAVERFDADPGQHLAVAARHRALRGDAVDILLERHSARARLQQVGKPVELVLLFPQFGDLRRAG